MYLEVNLICSNLVDKSSVFQNMWGCSSSITIDIWKKMAFLASTFPDLWLSLENILPNTAVVNVKELEFAFQILRNVLEHLILH